MATKKNKTKERQEWTRKREELERRERRIRDEMERSMGSVAIMIGAGRREEETRTKSREWGMRIGEMRKTTAILVATIEAKKVEEAKPQIERFEELVERAKKEMRDEWKELAREQQRIEDEIKSTESLIISIPDRPPSLGKRKKNPEKTKEEKEFDEFVKATGGVTGGWEELEHAEYLRARKRIAAGTGSLVEEMRKSIPQKTTREIVEHDRWFVTFTRLLSEKNRHRLISPGSAGRKK